MPTKTSSAQLIDQTRLLDKDATRALIRNYPQTVGTLENLILLVAPDGLVTAELFDHLCDQMDYVYPKER